MRILVFISALLAPTLATASSFLCMPETTVGWERSSGPDDIGVVEPQNKWVLQPIDPRVVPIRPSAIGATVEANYILKNLVDTAPYGACEFQSSRGSCWKFVISPDDENLLNGILTYDEHFHLEETDYRGWRYVFLNYKTQSDFSIDGNRGGKTRVAIETGNCFAF